MFLNEEVAREAMTNIVQKALNSVLEAPGRKFHELSPTQIGAQVTEKVEELLKADSRRCSSMSPMVLCHSGFVAISFCFLVLLNSGRSATLVVEASAPY